MQRLPLALVLAAVLCTLVPLAHATPPDEIWRPGIYDDTNFDNVVALVATIEITPPSNASPVPLFVQTADATFHSEAVGALTALLIRSPSDRAPPALRAIV